MCHQKIRIFEKNFIEQISKNRLYRVIFRLFPTFYAELCNIIFNFHKIGRFYTKIRKFLNIFGACGKKCVTLPNFSPKIQNIPIIRRQIIVSLNSQNAPLPWPFASPNLIPEQYPFESLTIQIQPYE